MEIHRHHNGEEQLYRSKVNENVRSGFVKLYRSLENVSWYKRSERVHLFIHLLLKASHSGYSTLFNGASRILQPGELVTGRLKLSFETGISPSKIYRDLKFFETEHLIKQQSCSTSSLITILNWNTYQKNEQQFEQRVNNGRTTSEQRADTIQEGKELNNEKKVRERDAHSSFFSLDECIEISLKDTKWIERISTNREELENFKNYLLDTGKKKDKTIEDFQSHFYSTRKKDPEKVKGPKAGKTRDYFLKEAKQVDKNKPYAEIIT